MAVFLKDCVRGSTKISNWLEEAKSGACGLDFLLVGDSNCGYGEPASGSNADLGSRKFGLADGLVMACTSIGINFYGSPVYPFGQLASTFGYGVGTENNSGGRTSGTFLQNETPANVGLTGTGASGVTTFNYFYKELSTPVLTSSLFYHDYNTSSKYADWQYISTSLNFAGTGTNYRNDGITILGEPWLNEKPVAYYRLTHSGTTDGGTCTVTMQANGAVIANSPSFSGLSATPTFKDSEYLMDRMAGGVAHTLPCYIKVNGFYCTTTAPFAFFFHSIYEKKVGISSSMLSFESGVKMEALRDKLITISTPVTGTGAHNGNYIGHYLNAVVRRQLAASSKNKGRVVIVIQGGTNQTTEGSTADARAINTISQFNTITSVIKAQWVKQGWSSENIAFLYLASPITNNTEMPALSRKFITSGIIANNPSHVTVVDHTLGLPASEYTSGSGLYDGANSTGTPSITPAAHLSEDGYLNWSKAIIYNLLNYSKKFKHLK